MDSLKETRDSTVKQLQGARDQAADAVDNGLKVTTDAAKQSIAYARDAYSDVHDEAQTYWETGVAHFERTQDQVTDKVKEGVKWATDNEALTVPALAAAAVLLLPGPRRFLWRQTIGRFRSEEALYRAAERKYGGVADALEGFSSEGAKLAQRLAAAEEQYDTGLRKLTATAKELASLQKRVRGTERTSASLVSNLRELPSREALALRAQAASQAAAAATQRQGLERTLWRLAKKGVY